MQIPEAQLTTTSAKTRDTEFISQQVPLSRLSLLRGFISPGPKVQLLFGTSELASTTQEKAGHWPHATMDDDPKHGQGFFPLLGYELTVAACQANQPAQP